MAPLENQLFARRTRIVYPAPNGADVVFTCHDHNGDFFYCKGDQRGRPVRATELICTRLAERLGIRTAPCAIVEHDGDTYFGSQQELSPADRFAVADYLTTPQTNELGQSSHFPGEYLAQLNALDIFLSNPDRGTHNFLLVKDGAIQRICAIDFADADLAGLSSHRFPVANSPTVSVGNRLRGIHGPFTDSAVEMVDRIAALPKDVFTRLVNEVPDEWLTQEKRGGLNEIWSSPGFHSRVAILRASLRDGTVL